MLDAAQRDARQRLGVAGARQVVRDLLRQCQEQRLVLEAVQVLVGVRVNHLGGRAQHHREYQEVQGEAVTSVSGLASLHSWRSLGVSTQEPAAQGVVQAMWSRQPAQCGRGLLRKPGDSSWGGVQTDHLGAQIWQAKDTQIPEQGTRLSRDSGSCQRLFRYWRVYESAKWQAHAVHDKEGASHKRAYNMISGTALPADTYNVHTRQAMSKCGHLQTLEVTTQALCTLLSSHHVCSLVIFHPPCQKTACPRSQLL